MKTVMLGKYQITPAELACVPAAETKAVIGIADGELIEGELKSSKLRLVQAWIEIHRDELMADWKLALRGENVFKIDPLK